MHDLKVSTRMLLMMGIPSALLVAIGKTAPRLPAHRPA